MFSTRIVLATFAVGLTISGGTAFAQQTNTTNNAVTPPQQNVPVRRGMMRRRQMRMGAVRQLDLTDQQRQQLRSIMQTQFQSTAAQRQELRQLMEKRWSGTLTDAEMARARELRQQLMQSRQAAHTQLVSVLTPEQKSQLETMRKNRQENRARFGPRKQRII